MQVDLVDGGHTAVRALEVRCKAHDPTVDLRLRNRVLVRGDDVLSGLDVEGTEREVQVLDAPRRRRRVTGGRGNRRGSDRQTDDARDHGGVPAGRHVVTVPGRLMP
jgi:hypothetical protein